MLKKLTSPFSMLLYVALIITTEGEREMPIAKIQDATEGEHKMTIADIKDAIRNALKNPKENDAATELAKHVKHRNGNPDGGADYAVFYAIDNTKKALQIWLIVDNDKFKLKLKPFFGFDKYLKVIYLKQ